MQANPKSVESLFNSRMRYIVPMFQRRYVWQESQHWRPLWEDIEEKANFQLGGIISNAHYLGAVIIEGVRPTSPREVMRFIIIDGQQRLTTLQLVFCALRDIARKNDWKTIDRTVTRYLENADQDVMENPDEEILKIWPTMLNRDIFSKIVLAGSRTGIETQFPLITPPRKRKPLPRNNMVDAYLYFSTVIENWITKTSEETAKKPEDCAFLLLQALQQDFNVVEIALSEGDDSQEIFYSLNSQGRPLSQSDLLRSLIFMRAEKDKIDRDKLFDDYWSKFETEFWSTEIKRGGRAYSRLELGLRYFLSAKTGEMVDTRRVNESYQSWISAKPPIYPSLREELADFARHGDAYQLFDDPSLSKLACTDLRRIITDFDVSTALPLILYLKLDAGLNEHQTTECLSIIESFIARRALTCDETKQYNIFFVELVRGLRGLKSEEVKPTLCKLILAGSGTTRRFPNDADVIENVISRPLYSELRTPALRLILERLEVGSRGKKAENAFIAEGLQIEHVMPQKWSTNWQLQDKVIPQVVVDYPAAAPPEFTHLIDAIRGRKIAVQTLGNLTILNQYLNPAASNASFDVKRVEYKNSVLRLNRYFDTKTEWNEQLIAERSQELGKLLCAIWPLPV